VNDADIDTPLDEPVVPLGPRKQKSRVVMWVSIATAVVLAAFIAILASSKQNTLSVSSPLIGHTAPPISGPGINLPGAYQLSSYSGKWVLVNFAASWCSPCRSETPQLEKFEQEHASVGDAAVLTVEDDPGDRADLAAFLRQHKATWPAVQDADASVAYGVAGLPESYLVDPDGTVIAKYDGEVTAAGIDKVISEATTAG
jgi:cytochrome c biogenesis protein CcmG/thiol:disulfide interchange protein DsbE